MKTVALVYHSGFGNTAKVAHSIVVGARSVVGVEVKSFEITGAQIEKGRWKDDEVMQQLSTSDAIIFGAPTYMGMVSGPFKCFADATAPLWMQMTWKDKLAAGFTSSSYPSGDKLMTLHYLVTLAAQLRMIWIGTAEPASNLTGSDDDIDRWGYYLGVGTLGSVHPGTEVPSKGELKTAECYGERVADAALRWKTEHL